MLFVGEAAGRQPTGRKWAEPGGEGCAVSPPDAGSKERSGAPTPEEVGQGAPSLAPPGRLPEVGVRRLEPRTEEPTELGARAQAEG